MLIPEKMSEMIFERKEIAAANGALESIQTRKSLISDSGVEFVVHLAVDLNKKWAGKALKKDHDPFLPYEHSLFVGDLSDTHVCLLTKYNVLENHILIVTKKYEEQTSPLTLTDFEAVSLCLRGMKGLVFYNSSEIAGASQRHKHLQFIEIAPDDWSRIVPIAKLFYQNNYRAEPGEILLIDELPYKHAFLWTGKTSGGCSPGDYLNFYRRLISATEPGGGVIHYNLLMTEEWMLLVPRSKDCYGGISINALGFCGTLFVYDLEDLDFIRKTTPFSILRDVGINVFLK